MHTVFFESKNRHSYNFIIDNQDVTLTFFQNDDKVGPLGVTELKNVLDEVDNRINSNSDMRDLFKKIGYGNLLKLITITSNDAFINYWNENYIGMEGNANIGIKKVFLLCIGTEQLTHYYNLPIVYAMRQCVANAHEKQKLIRNGKKNEQFCRIEENGLIVNFISKNNNVITYIINEVHVFEFCLSGRRNIKGTLLVHKLVFQLQQGLRMKNEKFVIDVVNALGGYAVLRLMNSVFPEETLDFFGSIADNKTSRRLRIYPQRIVKQFKLMSSEISIREITIYNSILSLLEKKMIAQESILIDGNDAEIVSDKDEWTLFYYSQGEKGTIQTRKITFRGNKNMISEQKEFLRAKAAFLYVKNNKISHLCALSNYLNRCITIFEDMLNISFHSITEITNSDINALRAFLLQKSEYWIKTQKETIYCLGSFYGYIAYKTGTDKRRNPFENIHYTSDFSKSKTHEKPLSLQVIKALEKELQETLPVVQLAFFVCNETAARAKTICTMAVEDIVRTAKGYNLVLFYGKEYEHKIRARKSPYVRHEISNSLATMLLDYIRETEPLRQLMGTSLVFVYQKPNRKDSQRLPVILNASSFSYYINKLLDGYQLFDEDGLPDICTFRRIRAEIGRGLFASGATAKKVADKLGNTEQVATESYNTMYPIDRARLYNRHFKETIGVFENDNVSVLDIPTEEYHNEMFVQCKSKKKCNNYNDCSICSQRIIYLK